MRSIAIEIEQTVAKHAALISAFNEADFSARRAPGKWSRKEILGHLIDSAQNNIQRFVRSQYEDTPKIVYAQEEWVRLQGYPDYAKDDLIRFWVLINRHLCRILTAMDPAHYEMKCNTGKTTVELHPLSFLAKDYLDHMIHHLKQIETEN